MKKFDLFTRRVGGRLYRSAGYVLALSRREAERIGSDRYLGQYVKALPAIVCL